MGKFNPDGTVVSDITGDNKSTASALSSSSSSRGSQRSRKKWGGKHGIPSNVATESFKGANNDLKGKVFIKGKAQASKYDEAYKALITYFGLKYDQRIYRAFEHKDADVGRSTITKPKPPMINKVVQEASLGDDSKMIGVNRSVIDKDGEEYMMYQISLKQYVTDLSMYNDNLEKCYSVIIGQCSPAIEQDLEGDDSFPPIKLASDSIGLIKILERICYSYQSHEYPPLGAWESLDRLSNTKQPDVGVSEANHHETFKTIVEVCKASTINFAMMCTANVDMAMKILHNDNKISKNGKYEDGTYFELTKDERKLVDEMAEEICLSTRFLSLSSNRLHGASKQELKNDLVKGDDKYPRTISNTISFLQHHNLRNRATYTPDDDKLRPETAFTQNGEEGEEPEKKFEKKVSATCRQWTEGTCSYKKKHTWKECPLNIWGINKGKEVDNKGDLILCTLCEFEEAMEFNDDDIINDDLLDVEDHKIGNGVTFYTPEYHSSLALDSLANSDIAHVFMQSSVELRAATLLSQNKGKINPNWLLLDSQSTVDLFHNASLLTNLRVVKETLKIHCNAGNMTTNMVGDFDGYGTVWYHKKAIANILSLYKVTTRFHVQFDSRTNNNFVVWRENESARYFEPSARGLYFCDVTKINGTILANNGITYDTHLAGDPAEINTVENNLKKFTQRQVRDAATCRAFQNTAGLTTNGIISVVDNKMLNNCPFTRDSIKHALSIWGPSIPNLDGKTTRMKGDTVLLSEETIPSIPPYILSHHSTVIIYIDVVQVNGIPFLSTVSKAVKLGTCTELSNTKVPMIVAALLVVVDTYKSRGFTILAIAADYAFEAIRINEGFMATGINLNTTSQDEHEPHIERFNRFLKERCRMCFSTLPFLRMPRRMTVELVYLQVFWINFYIPRDYISTTLSPGTIMTGRVYDYNMLCGSGTQFGTYVRTHENTDNTMRSRTVSAITLRPTGNAQGAFYYYSLATGRRLIRRRCTPIPMPDEIISRVHFIATRQKQPDGFAFTRMDGTPIPIRNDDDNVIDMPDEPVDIIADEIADEAPVPNDEYADAVENLEEIAENNPVEPDGEAGVVDELVEPDGEAGVGGQTVEPDGETGVVEPHLNINDNDSISDDTHNIDIERQDTATQEDDTKTKVSWTDVSIDNVILTRRRQRLPKKRDPLDGYGLTNIGEDMDNFLMAQTAYISSMQTIAQVDEAVVCAINHVVLTQMGMKKGIKVFGEAGVRSIFKEMKQFHDREVVRPLKPSQITNEVKRKALAYLMFLKMKSNGEIKARGCADGRPQRVYKTKEETSSPTAAVESIFITCAMAAKERRDVATLDIPGAFLQTEASDETFIKLQGAIVEALLKINPDWNEFVVYEGRKKVPTIYSEALKALYGTVDASKLFFEDLSSFLINELGFIRNPYDWCVVNKTINGKQFTIAWWVDDLVLSHADPKVVSDIIDSLSTKYGGLMPLTITRGKRHEYLGMVFDFNIVDKVKITMYQYMDGVIDGAPDRYKIASKENGVGMATPAPHNLYDVRSPDSEGNRLLTEKEREEYHTLTAQCLYLSKRARPDLQTSIAFHCTRVQKPDTDDEKKLSRTIRHMIATVHLPLILMVNEHGIIEWWVDASFAVHDDMKSRSGMYMTLGAGAIHAGSVKQKINTPSSTHAELVAVSDALPKMLWCRYFMESQNYAVEDVYVYQDNQSAILLENNGMQSCGKNSRHIKIKYFFVTDKVKNKELTVIYCPTKQMVGDFYTKPLQGELYFNHRNSILGINTDDMPIYIKDYKLHRESMKCIIKP